MAYISTMRRVRHAVLVLIGRVPYEFSTERMEFCMAFEKFTAAAAELTDAANRVIAKAESDASSATAATADLANADNTAAAAIQPVIDALNAAAPAPAPAAE